MPALEIPTQPLRAESRHPLTSPLGILVEGVHAAWTHASSAAAAPLPERIVAALRIAAAQRSLLTAGQRAPHPDGYARHLLYSDPAGRFTIVSIVWAAGQFSPAHGHHTWCAYAVHENMLQETLYTWNDASGAARAIHTQERPPGYGCFARAGLDQIHRLGNSGVELAISIHVYGVECTRVCTHVNRVIEITSH